MSYLAHSLVPMDVDHDDEQYEPEFLDQDGPGLFDDPDLPATPTAKPATLPAATDAEDAPLALYRRYRPEVFSEVIGQDHVTEPLKRALLHNRVNHAYLFSGPRGCGKTSSARILARSLNCERGPTPTPCGACQSCRDLARGGPGSIDVIEIDAASHGGVDDARDLRERAFFAPVHSRYKIYIVDEAHMVSPQGFNALLKLVEEPPPHVKFIFATTEPDKVIGTIRSRTHHYPFRLIPPKTMTTFLTQICEEEHVRVEAGVLPLVVRAGAGSVRDSLSVLDQLFGGASDAGVEYAQAASLLGYTPDRLLDAVVDAIAASDAGGVFAGVDKVIEAGQDPRRFAEDLLTRLRDLIIVAAVPDSLSSGLLDIPDDQAERYSVQAKSLGVGALTRAAEVLAAGLVAMRGTTTPRLQLELMCARILLPAADAGERGLHARIERIEKRLSILDQVNGGVAGISGDVGIAGGPAGSPAAVTPITSSASGPGGVRREPAPEDHTDGIVRGARSAAPPSGTAAEDPAPGGMASEASSAPVQPKPTRSAGGPATIETIRNAWPQILSRVSSARRYLWMILNQYASVTELNQTTLWVTFKDPGSRENFTRSGGEEQLAQAILAETGATVQVRARLDSEPIPADGRTAILSLAKPAAQPDQPAPAVPESSPPVAAPADEGPDDGPRPDAYAKPATPASTPDPAPDAMNSASEQAVPLLEPQPPKTRQPPKTTPARKAGPKPKPQPEPDLPSEDDDVVEDAADKAEELVMELFSAELIKEETTKSAPRKKN